jgi:hypothetical protein
LADISSGFPAELRRLARFGPQNARAGLDKEGPEMLYTIAVLLVVMWLLGMLTSYTVGGLIHVLLVIAIVVVLFRVIQGRGAPLDLE